MVDIKAWLNSRVKNYDAGVKLYLRFGKDPALVALFTKEAESDFKRTRLQQALQELICPTPVTTEANLKFSPLIYNAIKPEFNQLHKGWPNPITDPVIQALFEQWRPLYSELMSAQQRIYEVALQGENGNTAKALESCQLAHRIMDLDNQCDDLYAQRDHYLANGHLPDGGWEKEVVGDPVRWVTERQNALRYIRDYRAKIKKDPTNKLVPKWEQKILDWQKEVDQFNKLLKLDDE
ncbi:hypothetical protein FAM09_24910 [Niastella caeni]|uniref:Uncharacterized protein n=1 Tax=Niastella caeni TaxID=2569763 RepID=A0A4S8HH05_9BACT|nr:hypothetical protein [Niastella caeni]THU34263.1 hypothetical protein FAM09_24910 [Niastella caeni]